ncbi:tRNA (adenosine(37)-N6)-threonylcarbamoyltransferase complex ATPase subunit type 1 TsaE [Yinghuangia sp. ASG 101]|uniref:tRNA (adenosine(37)-N6)-threonylcarbamoyltransferase complex ATPase subunit type 1 TsaE n=1 Tax=Yinghuangia sp. ASG 101 TaxID=2896848 RepID=UPI001E29CF58|nr:tRNA (adenosine(37)-N6)-threonylcarbamoyltransferase complex ATPase subunit type 1 TsaE [Yinghuangia sp. ASG 101]UGQ14580.1 tRNA (adenosine(37)-N6)-threonylcarbamoyltransferase complex ATPase subunit type 1 TsaE [Yinghuangia sp. ASG 101]
MAGEAGPGVRVTVATGERMRDLGRRLAGLLRGGDLVVLSGGLGAGKTTLTQGLGAGLEVRGAVTSPTFMIARVHPPTGDGPALVHVDAYRLGASANVAAEVDDLDLDASLDDSVTVVEWGEGSVEDLAEDRLVIVIERAGDAGGPADGADDPSGDETRTVSFRTVGDRWAGIDLGAALGGAADTVTARAD